MAYNNLTELQRVKDLANKHFHENLKNSLDKMRELLEAEKSPTYVMDNFIKAVEYNSTEGKYVRGMSVVENDIIFTKNPTNDQLSQAALLGWLTEFVQVMLLILDDVMDQSDTRRGCPCSYKTLNVGYSIINDAFLLEVSVFRMIRKVFNSHPSGLELLDLYLLTCQRTFIGQSIDMMLCNAGQASPPDFTKFTEENYKWLVHHKTTTYTFTLPLMAAYYLATPQVSDTFLEDSQDILREIRLLSQIQDDYLDAYGDPKITGKIGTDIQDGKCSWLTTRVLTLLSESDRVFFNNNYWKNNNACIEEIKGLYNKYEMNTVYEEYVDSSVDSINKMFNEKFPPLFADYYNFYLNSIRRRDK